MRAPWLAIRPYWVLPFYDARAMPRNMFPGTDRLVTTEHFACVSMFIGEFAVQALKDFGAL